MASRRSKEATSGVTMTPDHPDYSHSGSDGEDDEDFSGEEDLSVPPQPPCKRLCRHQGHQGRVHGYVEHEPTPTNRVYRLVRLTDSKDEPSACKFLNYFHGAAQTILSSW